MSTRGIYIALGAIIAGITSYYLLSKDMLKDIYSLWKLSGLKGIGPAFALYFFTYPLRAERWRLLLPRRVNRDEMLKIVAFHTALANILPAKLGELAFPALLKKKGIKVLISGSLLLLGRGMDAVCILSLLLLTLSPLAGLSLIAFEFGFAFFGFKAIDRIFKGILTIPRLKEVYSRGWERFTREELIKAFGITYAVWIIKGAGIASLLTASGKMEFIEAFKGSIGAECSFLIPISGFLGLGNYEAGWVIASGTSIKEGFFAHSFLLISSALIALICSLTSLKTSSTDIEDMQGRTP